MTLRVDKGAYPGTGNPHVVGCYAALTWHGWKILDWRDGDWNFPGGGTMPWVCGVDAWTYLGPVGERGALYTPPAVIAARATPPAMEFDL